MEVSKLIQNMREQGIGIWTEGGKIRYLKKDGKLDDDIKNILIYNKLVDCLEKCLIYGHIRRVAD